MYNKAMIYIITSGMYSDYRIDATIGTDEPLDLDVLRTEFLEAVKATVAKEPNPSWGDIDFVEWLLLRPGVRRVTTYELHGAGTWGSTPQTEWVRPPTEESDRAAGIVRTTVMAGDRPIYVAAQIEQYAVPRDGE